MASLTITTATEGQTVTAGCRCPSLYDRRGTSVVSKGQGRWLIVCHQDDLAAVAKELASVGLETDGQPEGTEPPL